MVLQGLCLISIFLSKEKAPMSDLARKKATYEDLYNIPENMTGEIIDGELIVTPSPSRKHTLCCLRVGRRNHPPLQFGQGGGPGGWIIIIEPEIGLGEHTLVPDLAGWKTGKISDRKKIQLDFCRSGLGVRNPLPKHVPYRQNQKNAHLCSPWSWTYLADGPRCNDYGRLQTRIR